MSTTALLSKQEKAPQRSPRDMFRWDTRKLRAAALLAESAISDPKIATEAGCGLATLKRWKQYPPFMARVRDLQLGLEQAAMKLPIARKRDRLTGYNTRRDALLSIASERSAWFAAQEPETPGGKSGYLTRKERMTGAGHTAVLTVDYTVDSALLSELRALELQAAQDAGQWLEKKELTGVGGSPLMAIARLVVSGPQAANDDDSDGNIIDADFHPSETPRLAHRTANRAKQRRAANRSLRVQRLRVSRGQRR